MWGRHVSNTHKPTNLVLNMWGRHVSNTHKPTNLTMILKK
jgi:hypothetical protein